MGRLAMGVENYRSSRSRRSRLRAPPGAPDFVNDLELGVLYLSERRFEEARAALDRVAPSHASYPMALFKRAQVSVLLHEPDSAERIASARRHADATTAPLIARERLFRSDRHLGARFPAVTERTADVAIDADEEAGPSRPPAPEPESGHEGHALRGHAR